jgi:serine/threonine protein kinase
MAPEVISGRPYSERADMYSVSMILFELLTGNYPFEGLGQIEVAVQVSQHNVRPTIPDFCPAPLAKFIQQCWDIDPVKRISATQALTIIDSILPSVL